MYGFHVTIELTRSGWPDSSRRYCFDDLLQAFL
jgi:hypothetical protein